MALPSLHSLHSSTFTAQSPWLYLHCIASVALLSPHNPLGSTFPTSLHDSTFLTSLHSSTFPTTLYSSTFPTSLYGSTFPTSLPGSTFPTDTGHLHPCTSYFNMYSILLSKYVFLWHVCNDWEVKLNKAEGHFSFVSYLVWLGSCTELHWELIQREKFTGSRQHNSMLL